MGVSFAQAYETLTDAVETLFGADPRVCSVGIARHGEAYGYRAVRDSRLILPSQMRPAAVGEIYGVPVRYIDGPDRVRSLVCVMAAGPASPERASLVPEVQRHRPLVCGLQIQNYDDDLRQGVIADGMMTIGTLGCFVRRADGSVALLSNNHIIGGENRGLRGQDRILQAGGAEFEAGAQVARLADVVELRPSPAGARSADGTVLFNQADAALAALDAGVGFAQAFLARRQLPAPAATAAPRIGDRVLKVGRTSGLTYGIVTEVGTTVGPVRYGHGECWFNASFVVEGEEGTLFSDGGDSGAIVMRPSGEVLGMLYAGNGEQCYACGIDAVLAAFQATLA